MEGRGWTEAEDARLRELWDLGLSAGEIGAALKRSKNSVIGRAHRLPLPARPTPIRAKGSGAPKSQRGALAGVAKLRGSEMIGGGTLVALGVVPAVAVAPAAPVVAARAGAPSACCWPIGDPRAPGFRFCAAASVPGRPYCAEHCGVAYEAPKERSAAQVAADDARRAAAHARMAARGGFSVGGFRPDWSV